jgi:hypothetical protein
MHVHTFSPLNLKLLPSIRIDLVSSIASAASHLERIRRPKRILHKLHVNDLALRLINLTPHAVRAPARLSQRPAPVRKAPKHRYIHQPILRLGGGLEPTPRKRSVGGTVGPTEDGVDGEFFVGPDLRHGREGVDDGVGAFVLVAVGVGKDLLQGRVGIGERDVRGGGADKVADDGLSWFVIEHF